MAEGGYGYENSEVEASNNGDNPAGVLGYLKLCCKTINEDLAAVGICKPVTLKNLETLDSSTFQKILIYLLNSTGVYRNARFQVIL